MGCLVGVLTRSCWSGLSQVWQGLILFENAGNAIKSEGFSSFSWSFKTALIPRNLSDTYELYKNKH
jgi:hypothetical protein